MNVFLYGTISIFIFLFIKLVQRIVPIKGLKFLDEEAVMPFIDHPSVKILDIRDPVDYEKGHLPGAINIYVGRLPYVSHKELTITDEIIIISSSLYHIKKAARILLKAGYRHLHSHKLHMRVEE